MELQVNPKKEEIKKEEQLPVFVTSLISNTSPQQLQEADKTKVKELEEELLGMHYEISEIPTTDSLVKLYSAQAKGRAFYERSEEIYRQYLKYLSTISLLLKKAQFVMNDVQQQASVWMRKNRAEDLKLTKSTDERNNLIYSIIPLQLKEELFQWETLEAQAKTNFSILRSYRDQFKSINDNVLIQLSIMKNLIMLGELKVDPEIIRAMRVIDTSYKPTNQDFKDKQEFDSPVEEINVDEGTVNL